MPTSRWQEDTGAGWFWSGLRGGHAQSGDSGPGGRASRRACGGGEDGASDTSADSEQVEIRTSIVVAATPGAEPIATGEVLEGSTLGGSPFCVGGPILDSHGSPDPEVWLIARTITCREGRVRWN